MDQPRTKSSAENIRHSAEHPLLLGSNKRQWVGSVASILVSYIASYTLKLTLMRSVIGSAVP